MTSPAVLRRSAIFGRIQPPYPATGAKIRTFTGKNRPPNHAFARAANRLSGALKNTQKTLFIQ
jgi:hypothetical protein